jgi:hypothetical protein
MKYETEELVNIFTDWQGLENETISLSEELYENSQNSFVKVIMEMIKRDSEKHRAMLEFAITHLTKEATHLTAEELISIGELLEKHLTAEAKSMGLASTALTKTKDFFMHFIVSYLLDDEVKHHEMLTRLDQIKGKIHSVVP